MANRKIRLLVYTALFAAITTVMTLLHVPVGNGYVHVGDAVLYLGAIILPFPYGIFAAAIGEGLADVFSGYVIYLGPTLIVKSLNALCFYIPFKKHKNIVTLRTIIAICVSSVITVVGYFIAEWLLFNKAAALAYLPRCYVQPLASLIVFVVVGTALDQTNLFKRIKL